MNDRKHLASSLKGRWALLFALPVALAGVVACGSEAPSEESAPATAPVEAPASSASGRRVFFVEPQDGATVKSPVLLRFDVEGYEIAPVPSGEVTSVRENIGHHHVGLNTDCLPPGTPIPQAEPWVHFGDGKNEMTMQLPPGQHRLTLQVGDDKHQTIEGLCSSITVTVAE